MEQYLKVLLAGIRKWVNGKLEDISFVISNHINELTGRVETVENAIASGAVGATGATGPQGVTGPQGATGAKGETGRGFHIDHTYASIEAMEADTEPPVGDFAMIITSDETHPDYGKVYVKTESGWAFQVDMSVVGATGIIGPQGATGPQGEAGLQGETGATGATGPAGSYTPTDGLYIENGVIGMTGIDFTESDVVAFLEGTIGV